MSSTTPSASGTSSSSTAAGLQPRLGPAWRSASNQGGRGFQPPPAATRRGSNDGGTSDGVARETLSSNQNSFSLLDMDDDAVGLGGSAGTPGKGSLGSTSKGLGGGGSSKHDEGSNGAGFVKKSSGGGFMSRSEGLRSAGAVGGSSYISSRAASTGSKGGNGGSGGGRSLAELASRVSTTSRNHGQSSHQRGGYDDSASNNRGLGTSRANGMIEDKNIIRFTREKLLSMRPRPDGSSTGLPDNLQHLEGLPLVSIEPLDPVCWDTFDAEAIWAVARERSRGGMAGNNGSKGAVSRREGDVDDRRSGQSLMGRSSSIGGGGMVGGGGGRWQRGVALPPPDEHSKNRQYDDAENPDDLWDDPNQIDMAAAADFSAFGASLDGAPGKPMESDGGFDLSSLSEMAQKFDSELHGDGNGGTESDEKGDNMIDPLRPLASAGTTIKSGSGDNINVFEDFGAPEDDNVAENAIKSGNDQTASSRLMQMIGVSQQSNAENQESEAKLEDATTENENELKTKEEESFGPAPDAASIATTNAFGAFSSSVPSNPWGDPILSSSANDSTAVNSNSSGLDLAATLREAEEKQRLEKEAEEQRKREKEEEEMRVAMLARQQAEAQARQQAMQAQQQKQQSGPNQMEVELILTERISTILENSWGRADLMTILQTLHREDSRVAPLLSTVESLRALIARHPRRIALVKDQQYGTEMAVLAISNSQWQQQRQEEELLVQRQQEEQQQKRREAEAKAEAELRAKEAAMEPIVITNDPWYYADPQRNVQGPFNGMEMRQWLEAGYFKGDLPISQSPSGPFRKLATLFPDLSVAFKPTEPSQSEKEKIAAEEREAQEAKAKKEAEMKAAEAEARAAEEEELQKRKMAEAKAREASKDQAASHTNQKQSDQLKMLLGLGGSIASGGIAAAPKSVQNIDESIKVAAKPEDDSKEAELEKVQENLVETVVQPKASKTKPVKDVPPEPTVVPTPVVNVNPAPVAAPAWGGAATNKSTVQRKSMSEIQREEARVSRVAKQREKSSNGSGGWANIAKSGGASAWSGTTAISTSAPSTSSATVASAGSSNANNYQQSRSKQQISLSSTHKQTMSQSQRSTTQKTMEEFGANGKMSPALESWCKEQMLKIHGSEDLTLIAFCMTLSDPVEIKQYLTAYLGSSSQVNNFATEFINRKSGKSKQEEQWETTGTSKKGRKKKTASK